MKRLAIAILTLFFLVLPLSRANAQDSWRDASFADEYDAADQGAVNQGAYVDRATKGNITSINCMLLPTPGLCTNDTSKFTSMYQNSVMGKLSTYLSIMFVSPPASTYAFVRDTAESLGFAPKTANAQGIGFSGLSGLLPLWKAFRNISYLILALVIIVIGFMVMLRRKIDPKTVVTVQNALPRIVITLLLITFSYAIVGLAIDAMYLMILLAAAIFKTTGQLPAPASTYINGGILENLQIAGNNINPYTIIFGQNITGGAATGISWALGLAGLIGGIALSFVNPLLGIGAGLLFGAVPLLHLLIVIAMLLITVRLFFFFLGAYIKIIISLIFGPIQILFEAVPGSTAFSSWFRNLIANVLVFPAGAVMFMLAGTFANLSLQGGGNTIWTPPFVALFSSNATAIGALIAAGLLFSTPTIINQIQDALKAKPLVQAGPEGLTSVFTQPLGMVWQLGQFYLSHRQMSNIAKRLPGGNQGEQHPPGA